MSASSANPVESNVLFLQTFHNGRKITVVIFYINLIKVLSALAQSQKLLLPSRPPVLTVRPHASSRLPLDAIPWNFMLETFIIIYRGITDVIKICPKISRTSHEYLRILYCCQRHYIAIKTLSSSEMVSGCYLSWGDTETKRTRHNVTLHVHYPILLQFM